MSDFWDQFAGGTGFISFDNVGDAIVGDVLAVSVGSDFNGNPCPKLVIRDADDEERTLTAGQVVLKNKLAEYRPSAGERISITYTGAGDAKPGKAPAKLFTVVVKNAAGEMRGDVEMAGATAAPAPAATPAPQPAAAPVSASALLDGL